MTPHQLKAARKAKGLTQVLFANLLGVSYSAVTKWETGGNPIPDWVRERLTDKRQSLHVTGLTAGEVAQLENIAAVKHSNPDTIVAELVKWALNAPIIKQPVGES